MTGFLTLDLLRTHDASFDLRRALGLDHSPVLALTWHIDANGRPISRWQDVRDNPH